MGRAPEQFQFQLLLKKKKTHEYSGTFIIIAGNLYILKS